MKARLIAYDFEQHGTRIKGRVLCVESTDAGALVAALNEAFGDGSHWIESRAKPAHKHHAKAKNVVTSSR